MMPTRRGGGKGFKVNHAVTSPSHQWSHCGWPHIAIRIRAPLRWCLVLASIRVQCNTGRYIIHEFFKLSSGIHGGRAPWSHSCCPLVCHPLPHGRAFHIPDLLIATAVGSVREDLAGLARQWAKTQAGRCENSLIPPLQCLLAPGVIEILELLPKQVVERRQIHPRVVVYHPPLFHCAEGYIHH